jgi:hemoglobin/transferrin/lactoferrin receptor protein
MFFLALALLVTAPAIAQSETRHTLNIPAGPLGTAIARLGSELGVIVSADAALVRGQHTAGLSGSYTHDAALEALLAGSGLNAVSDGNGGYRLVKSAPSTQSAPTATAINSNATPATTDLEEVLVVGAMTQVDIDADQIARRQVNDLSDLFRQVPSVSVGGSVGIAQKIYVRGLEDSLLNVTVDGAPQHGTLFHHIGRVSIEPELLKTVEVQTGAGEATSGFGAIGGAIRFKTKDIGDLLEPGKRFGGLAKAGYFTNDGHKLSGSVFGRFTEEFGFLASVVHSERDDAEDGDGNRLYGSGAKQQLGFLKLGGNISAAQHISISYEHRDESASFGQRPNWPALEGDTLFPATGLRQTAVLNYGVALSEAMNFEATGYWTRSEFTQDRFDAWGLYESAIRSAGFDLRMNFELGTHDTVFGVEYRDDHVSSEYAAAPEIWGDWAWDPAIGRFVEQGEVFGIYLQDHWQLTEPLLLSVGARYDEYDLEQVTYENGTDSSGFSFNAGLNYQLNEAWTLNASFAEAFRGKEIGDAFTLEKRPGRISLAPGLQPERVDNYEIGMGFERDGFRASAVYYQTQIDDVILDQIGNGPPPQAPVYYENVGTFEAEGVELKAGWAIDRFSIDGYFNHFSSELNGDTVEGYEHIGLGNSVGDSWALSMGYEVAANFRLEAAVTRFADLNNIEVLQRGVQVGWIGETQFVDKPGFTVVDLFADWQPFSDDRFTLSAAVYNLFDKHYRAHSSVADYNHIPDWEGVAGVYEPGRNIRLTATFAF